MKIFLKFHTSHTNDANNLKRPASYLDPNRPFNGDKRMRAFMDANDQYNPELFKWFMNQVVFSNIYWENAKYTV